MKKEKKSETDEKEKKEDTIYDLEGVQECENSTRAETEGSKEAGKDQLEEEENVSAEDNGKPVQPEEEKTDETPDGKPEENELRKEVEEDGAAAEIRSMVAEMGAQRVLELIRDNRNAAIEQIMSEMENSEKEPLQSGLSIESGCRSIFDLASLA